MNNKDIFKELIKQFKEETGLLEGLNLNDEELNELDDALMNIAHIELNEDRIKMEMRKHLDFALLETMYEAEEFLTMVKASDDGNNKLAYDLFNNSHEQFFEAVHEFSRMVSLLGMDDLLELLKKRVDEYNEAIMRYIPEIGGLFAEELPIYQYEDDEYEEID